MCLGVGAERLLRWFAHLLGGVESRGHSQYSVFVPSSSEVVVGFCFFFILLSRICPICACMQLFLVPYNFFVFCCSRRRLSRRKPGSTAAKGLRSQPVSE